MIKYGCTKHELLRKANSTILTIKRLDGNLEVSMGLVSNAFMEMSLLLEFPPVNHSLPHVKLPHSIVILLIIINTHQHGWSFALSIFTSI